MNFIFHLQECLRSEIPEALLCCKHELNDLHQGQANNE